MGTVTDDLIRNMARVKKAEAATCGDLKRIAKIAEQRHDEAAAKVADLDDQLKADPGNEALQRKRDEYDRVRSGLYAAIEYARGLHEQTTGEPPTEPQRHDERDVDGAFTKKHSLGGFLRKLMKR